jgi:trigger factor
VDSTEFEFVATFEIFPEIELKPFDGLSITRLQADISEADIDEMLETLRQQQARFELVDRAAALDDQVVIDFEGFKGGEPFAGGKGDQQKLVLGSGQMIPGFEDGIVGMKAGEEKAIAVSFPDDYHSEELKGQSVEFQIKLHTVSAKALAELDDAFFSQFGVKEGGMPAFREEVRKNMTREMKSAALNKLKQNVIDELVKLHEVALPNVLLGREIQQMRGQMMQQFGAMAEKLDPASIFPDDMFRDQASKRVTTGLIFAEIIRQKEVKLERDRLKAKVEEMASVYNNPTEVVKHYMSNKELLAGIENMVMEEQVIDLILAGAKVDEKSSSYKEIISREEQDNG